MPIYPPRNTAIRKKQILDYKIFEFLKCNELEKSKKKIEQKAELVRVAMLNHIKARLALIKPYKADDRNESDNRLQEKLKTDMRNWNSFTFNEIKQFCIKQGND